MEDYIPHQRLRLLAAKIHRLGPRPLYELLVELQAGAPLVPRLERYAELPADFIRSHGGDRLPEPRLVAGGRFLSEAPEHARVATPATWQPESAASE